ncbi:MAG: ATP synthase subunit I [Gammaproteobacteria bacterium]
MAGFSVNLNSGWTLSKKWLIWQCGILCIVAIIYYLLAGPQASYSASLGALVSVISNAYFAWKLFTHTGARAAQRIVINLYVAEGVKLLISAVGLAAIFIWLPADPTPALVGFLITYLSSLVVIGVLTLK